MNWLIVLISVITLLVLVAVTKIRVKVVYKHRQDDDLLEMKVFLWSLKVYTYSAPMIKVDDESAAIVVKEKHNLGSKATKKRQVITPQKIMDYIDKIKQILQHIVGLNEIVKTFLSRVQVHHFDWHTMIGVGDAAHTARLAGGIWSLKGSIAGFFCHYLNMKQLPKLNVQPRFNEWASDIHFSCMVSFRIGHAIVAGLMLIRHWKRRPTLEKVNSVEENM